MEIKKEVKDLGSSNIQLDVVIDKKDAKEAYGGVIATYVKSAQIPGFRKGKVPAAVLEQRFGKSLKMEAASNLIEKALTEIFETDDKSVKPLGYEQPELVGDIDFEPDKDFAFSVTYDVFPQTNLKKIDGFTLKTPVVTDIDKAIDEELKVIQRNNSLSTKKTVKRLQLATSLLWIMWSLTKTKNLLQTPSERISLLRSARSITCTKSTMTLSV